MIKINTNTKIKNLAGDEFTILKNKKEEKLTVGDVLFATLNNARGIELKISWALLPKLALSNEDIELDEEQQKALIKSVEQSAELPQDARFNLVVYGRVLDILNGVSDTKSGKKK